ncbi:hypothetical protein UY3_01910 [Chelonia mydas]|uniref:Uncharacterized protein n=1 Tax=Chelonia mydas TaxID=8469 RepID=M7BUB1_CHEMY|nr:hypothetical protein UY3_01910 [Chelonia mydas]
MLQEAKKGEVAMESGGSSSDKPRDRQGDREEKGYDRDCMKAKELRQAYQKAREGNNQSGAKLYTCCFDKELLAILAGDLIPTPNSTMDTAEEPGSQAPAMTSKEEEVDETGNQGIQLCNESGPVFNATTVQPVPPVKHGLRVNLKIQAEKAQFEPDPKLIEVNGKPPINFSQSIKHKTYSPFEPSVGYDIVSQTLIRCKLA